jgi:NADH dehydrogenase
MINIPGTEKKRVVIAGCGFGGLTLAKKLKRSGYQVVILDKHNYHQFPPLFYQVASVGRYSRILKITISGKLR